MRGGGRESRGVPGPGCRGTGGMARQNEHPVGGQACASLSELTASIGLPQGRVGLLPSLPASGSGRVLSLWGCALRGRRPSLLGHGAVWGSSSHLTDLGLDDFQRVFNGCPVGWLCGAPGPSLPCPCLAHSGGWWAPSPGESRVLARASPTAGAGGTVSRGIGGSRAPQDARQSG